jgi:hypothetical protein
VVHSARVEFSTKLAVPLHVTPTDCVFRFSFNMIVFDKSHASRASAEILLWRMPIFEALVIPDLPAGENRVFLMTIAWCQ